MSNLNYSQKLRLSAELQAFKWFLLKLKAISQQGGFPVKAYHKTTFSAWGANATYLRVPLLLRQRCYLNFSNFKAMHLGLSWEKAP